MINSGARDMSIDTLEPVLDDTSKSHSSYSKQPKNIAGLVDVFHNSSPWSPPILSNFSNQKSLSNLSICASDYYTDSSSATDTPSTSISPPFSRATLENNKMSLDYLLNSSSDLIMTETDLKQFQPQTDLQNAPDSISEFLEEAKSQLTQIQASYSLITPTVYRETLKYLTVLLSHPTIKHRLTSISEVTWYLGASLLIAFRNNQIQFSFKQISSILRFSKTTLIRTYRESNIILGIETENGNVENCVFSIASALQYPSNLISLSQEVASRMMPHLEGRNIRSIAAVSVYLVGNNAKIPHLTRKDVATISGVSDVTLWTLSKIMKDKMHLIFPS